MPTLASYGSGSARAFGHRSSRPQRLFNTWTNKNVATGNTLTYVGGAGNTAGKYYMVGGYTGSSAGSMYDATSNTWTSVTLNRTTQETAVCGVADGFYVIGGCRHLQASHGDVSYVTNAGSASAVTAITSRHGANVFRSDTYIWAFGGVTATCGSNYSANNTIMRANISGYSGFTQVGSLTTWSSPTATLGDTIYHYTSATPTMYNSSLTSLGSGPSAPSAPNHVVRVDIPGEAQRLLLLYNNSSTIYSFDGTTYTTITTNITMPTGALTKIDLCGTGILLATASTTWMLT